MADEPLLRRSLTAWLDETGEVDPPRRGGSRSATAGTLVHRLFQSGVGDDDRDDAGALAVARGLLTANERATAGDVDAVVAEAVGAWRSLQSRKDVAALLAGDRVFYEVPFSMTRRRRQDRHPVILRGAIDCLVQKNDGSILVLEFKTGRPHPSHQRQLDLYVEAAALLYPGARIEGRLVYAD